MTGPTGADQQTPDERNTADWDQVLRDQADLYDERRRRHEQDDEPPTDSPPPPGR